MKVNEYGAVETRYTLKSIFNGLKAYVMNKPIDAHIEKEIRTLLNQNFKTDFKMFIKSTFSVTAWKDTIKYNMKYSSLKGMFSDGAATNSMISQGIDDHKLEWDKVGEDVAAGAVFGAISFGIDKGIGAVKTKIFGEDTTKTTAKSVYKELDKATDGLKKAQGHLDDVINSGHRPSSLTKKFKLGGVICALYMDWN